MMRIVSGIIMFIGLFIGFIILVSAKSAPQEAISLVPIIGAYVLGRALENFSNMDEEVLNLLRKLSQEKIKEEPEIEETIIESEEHEIEEEIIESEIINEEIPDNLETSKPLNRNRIIAVITIVIVISSIIFYFDSYVDLNGSWRQPTSFEVSKLSSVINEYEITCESYYVKKINNHKYFIACVGNGSDWVYREIDIEKEKMYVLSRKNEQKLKPPE